MSMRMIVSLVFCVILTLTISHGTIAVPPRGNHYNLTKELLSDYGPTEPRPVTNASTQINVTLDVMIQQVIDFNERDQTLKISGFLWMQWHDDFLTWEPDEYPDVPYLIISSSGIWRPDLHLYENVDKTFESLKDTTAFVAPVGTVEWGTPFIFYTACRIDARLFPFDTQHCTLRFGSWAYPKSQLNLMGSTRVSNFKRLFVENGIWDFKNLTLTRSETYYDSTGVYPELLFTIALRRRPWFHILSFILPCALLSILNLLVFILPTASGEKVSLGITNLLALVLFQQLISDTLPPSSDTMPIISYYFAPMIIIGCLSIASGVLVAALYHKDRRRSVPRWLRKILNCSSSSRIAPSTEHYINARALEEIYDQSTMPIDSKSVENLTKEKDGVSHGHELSNVEYAVDSTKNGKKLCRCHLKEQDDDLNEWHEIARVVDNIMLSIAVVVTLSSFIVTMVLFVTTK